MSTDRRFLGPNAGYVLELYDRYRENPESVPESVRRYFERWQPEELASPAPPAPARSATATATAPSAVAVDKIVGASDLAESIRQRGYRAADLDPLGTPPPGDRSLDPASHGLTEADLAQLPASVVGGPLARDAANAAEAIRRLREIYCATSGYDYEHVQHEDERQWLAEAIESRRFSQPLSAEQKLELLKRLTAVEGFERFLHRAFVGQKRFSIEGTDITVPMLDEIIREAADGGTGEVIIGMAHRGRLNVMAHVLGKPYAQIIGEFMGIHHREPTSASDAGSSGWTGDVKYHMGAYRPSGQLRARITLAANPSHLEFVNPVIEGMARAGQDDRGQRGAPRQNVDASLPINLHGDAALPGEGVAAETLNLSRLAGYQTGGTLHLISNNQIGYTTEPDQSRSTAYASDLARGFEIPVVHVNGDDPESCLAAARMAYAYRQRFHKDFLVDVVGYRRWGHNEGDEPAFTQPLMYALITKRPTVRAVWAQRLEQEGVIQPGQADQLLQQTIDQLQQIRAEIAASNGHREEPPTPIHTTPHVRQADTAVPLDRLERLNQQIHALPEGFTLNPKLQRNMAQRAKAVAAGGPIDWAHAEDLALASILADGTPIRMTGQDVERGTFSQRHLNFHDVNTGQLIIPLQHLEDARASFALHNSPLSEAAPLGFEYGYSVHAPEALVIWEAQFGDFANVGQVIVDQFIAAGRAKWDQTSSLVMLLPHGYEGQGPEHSSARLERYLQLCANDNLRVANCTTSAQYFHLLRKQAALLERAPRPLILMTPKVLLRHPLAGSPVEELTGGEFQPVLDDPNVADRQAVTRVVACSGKVYVDVAGAKERADAHNVAVIRLELLYPFPQDALRAVLGRYPNARQLIWLQEEPRNMGAWTFVHPWLETVAGDQIEIAYVGRPERASPAEGWAELHTAEQSRIVHEALSGALVAEESYGVKHGD